MNAAGATKLRLTMLELWIAGKSHDHALAAVACDDPGSPSHCLYPRHVTGTHSDRCVRHSSSHRTGT
jgi:hypothetical protein